MRIPHPTSVRMMAFLAALVGAAAAAPGPQLELFTNTSACTELADNPGTKSPWGRDSGSLRFLGVQPTMAACSAAAAAFTNASAPRDERRCLSTCWFHSPQNVSFVDQCYCRVTPQWMPLPTPKADSAVITWPCTGRRDCSYNGVCAPAGGAGGCTCDAGWKGVRCGELALLPVDRSRPGFRQVAQGENVSTWGSPMLFDEKGGEWHGWASEMTHGCGM